MPTARNAPPSPPSGHKSHKNHIQVFPEIWRRLENIYPLDGTINEVIVSWMDDNIPDESPDESEANLYGNLLTIPCHSTVKASLDQLKAPDNILHMIPWFNDLTLKTVQNVVHLVYPEIHHWTFSLVNDADDMDSNLFRYFSWSSICSQPLSPYVTSRNSLTIAFQPPWILSEQDIREFAECRSFPPIRRSGDAYPIALESQHRLWAKLWDVCVQRRTHWFILSSYNNWVFGVFSEAWSSGFVTGVYTYDSCAPSIAECLIFWLVSSMRIAGSASIPKIPESLDYRILPALVHPYVFNSQAVPPEDSESNWQGKNNDAESSAGVRSNLSEIGSHASGMSGPIAPMNRLVPQSLQDPITKWLADASFTVAPNEPAIIPATVQQLVPEKSKARLGDWLV